MLALTSVPLKLSAMLCLLQFVYIDADYKFEVSIESYRNPSNKLSSGSCCDDVFCLNPCDPHYDICVRPSQHSHDDLSNCPLGDVGTVDGSLPITASTTGSSPWPGSFQLYLFVGDTDPLFNDRIDTVFAESSRQVSSQFSSVESFTGSFRRVTLELRFRVTCTENYYDPNCTTFCVEQNNDVSGHYTCDATDGSIECREGYRNIATNCVEPVCMSGCSSDGGYCEDPGECLCQDGWNGVLCDQCMAKEGCSPDGGYCNQPDECICHGGWNGSLCDQCIPTEGCSPVGGYCNEPGECLCRQGWNGSLCDEEINACGEFPCDNGATCVPLGRENYTCNCTPGFYGDNCETDLVNDCVPNTCKNGGTCVDLVRAYSCICTPGFTGEDCGTDVDNCEGVMCPENARCVDRVDSYDCICHSGFEGAHCSVTSNNQDTGSQSDDDNSDGGSQPTGIIAGAVVGGIVMLICVMLVILVVILFMRRKRIKANGSDVLMSGDVTTKSHTYEMCSPSDSTGSPDLPQYEETKATCRQTLADNPMYGTNPPATTVISPDTIHEVDNPLYGGGNEDPQTAIYSEPNVAYEYMKPDGGRSDEPYAYAYTKLSEGEKMDGDTGQEYAYVPANATGVGVTGLPSAKYNTLDHGTEKKLGVRRENSAGYEALQF